MAALLPVFLLRLWWRGRQLPAFRAHWRERLGWYPALDPDAAGTASGGERSASGSPAAQQEVLTPKRIWLHAVSLGETQASLTLLRALQRRWPQTQLILTHMTPTGRAAGAAFGLPGLWQAYLPYDFPGAMARFLRHFEPELGILIETEVWPGLIRAAQHRACPLVLANARLSPRSHAGYRRLGAFARAAFGGLAATGAQTEADGARLADLGADPVEVTGNLKFDALIPEGEDTLACAFRARWGEQRQVWLAASTREGEEALLLDALTQLPPEVLLVMVPRHPQRFDEVAQLIVGRGLKLQRRSDESPVSADTRVLLGDSLGELGAYYRSCELALVGGSLLPFGGQNLLEACARGCPVLIGPHTFNFSAAADGAIAAGAALRVDNVGTLSAALRELLASPARRAAMAAAGLQFIAQHRGATARTLAMLEEVLAAGVGRQAVRTRSGSAPARCSAAE
jgi:3-deoxy-D-manno-octulosonic-acid transferase